ncbi:short chain dehydrogenase [Myriangium duriaei CBS 260.36]|uniref:Short chain dehydrogenase n=1 Tax=Myriangium duriaei CBS 260.36 TaxID=1168546 RepID=A0A9P4J1L4_9PEZI|nr:short chain dehydrogenase [Myriangium duriaei CBS 260.36]
MAYSGRLAIITGGLGGLGTATATLLRQHSARLALLYAPFEAARRDSILKSSFGSETPHDVRAYECDITSESSIQSVFQQISADTSSSTNPAFPSILINAAGYVSVQPLESTSADEAARNILPNLLGPLLVSNAFYHLYTSRRAAAGTSAPPGRIVSISSQAAHLALNGHGAYCASKAGLNGLTRCQANEWGRKGITANTVSPTVALTALGKKAWAEGKQRDDHLARIPTGRFVEPEEVAAAIEFLCRDEAGMITGGDVRIDGGFTTSGGFTMPGGDAAEGEATVGGGK